MKKIYIIYKSIISPILHLITATIDQGCRYHPTCSQYAYLSWKKHGPIKGTLKAIQRILSCHPFSKGGVDYP